MSSNNSLDKILSFVINLMSHTFILLTFLIIFFFLYISKLTASHIDDELHKIVSTQTTNLMISLDQQDTNKYINWNAVNIVAGNLALKYQGVSQEVTNNNSTLYDNCICFLVLFGMSIVILTCYFMIRGINLRLKFIAVENLVIFTFVGMVEIYFFMNIASKYIPVLPDDALKTVISRLKDRLSTGNN